MGWVSIGPRLDYHRLAGSRATPPVDEARVWVIPCLTVRKEARDQGVATALIRAAVAYAMKRGAPAAREFMDWLKGSAAKQIFKKYGFN